MRIQTQRETFAFRIAAAADWRPDPGLNSKHTVNFHTMPMENGDKLHVYQPSTRQDAAENPDGGWVHEIHPHDLPSRHPLPDANEYLPPSTRYKTIPNIIGRNPEIDPKIPNPDSDADLIIDPIHDPVRRRNLSLHTYYGPTGKGLRQNGRTLDSKEEAMDAVEQRYREHAPQWNRGDHSSGVDYSDLNSFKDFL